MLMSLTPARFESSKRMSIRMFTSRR